MSSARPLFESNRKFGQWCRIDYFCKPNVFVAFGQTDELVNLSSKYILVNGQNDDTGKFTGRFICDGNIVLTILQSIFLWIPS